MPELSELSEKLIKQGWRRVTDVEPILPEMGRNAEYVSFLRGDQVFVSVGEVLMRAIELSAKLGQGDAEWLFEHEEGLAECPENVRYLLFPGTEWAHPNGARLWPYLYRTGKAEKKWGLYVFWLDFGFSRHARLVRPVVR